MDYSEIVHIILADDDEDDHRLIKEALKEVKTKTIFEQFEDGEELMEYLKGENIKLPDIIMLDINMPKKTGIQCLLEIRALDMFNDVAIVMYSTSDNERDIESCFQKGANKYIVKPHSFPTLIKTINQLISIDWQYQRKVLKRENFLLTGEYP